MQEGLALPVNFHSKEVTMNCNMPTDSKEKRKKGQVFI